MGLHKEREQKTCLNCQSTVAGRYCQVCGQENVETDRTIGHLIAHFFQDITHYDGKFFSTLRLLISRPGFLSAEYIRGRRARYLGPVRMYVFTSALFFLVFLTLYKPRPGDLYDDIDFTVKGKTYGQVSAMDSTAFDAFTREINRDMGRSPVPMTRDEFRQHFDSVLTVQLDNGGEGIFSLDGSKIQSQHEYDSLVRAGAIHDGWLVRKMRQRQFELNKQYKGRGQQAVLDYGRIFLQKLPQLLFVSLPLLALLLKLLYAGQRRFLYVDHALFAIHLYVFIFLALLLEIGLGKMGDLLGWSFFSYLRTALGLAIFFYTYKAMRNFYGQGRAETLIKFLLVNFLFFIVMILLLSVFLVFSVFSL